MENNKDNQFTTIVVLFFIGFLIYYLTRPSSYNENFAEIPSVNNSNTTVNANATINPNATVNANPTVNANANINISSDDLKQILADSETNVTKCINDINPNDDDIINTGAELNNAFVKPNVPELTPDVINSNKNNVKNYNVKDFLPKEINDQWFDTDFSQAKYNINDDKLINTERYVIGINTVGQSLKNASWDIRGSIPNPKFSVSPWNNSTIEADYNIKPLC